MVNMIILVLDKIYFIYLEIHLPQSFCNVTIVTAYYRMSSKHSNEEYLSWMSNFLTLQDCMVIFTQQDFVSTIQILRPAYYQTIINIIELNQKYEDHHVILGIPFRKSEIMVELIFESSETCPTTVKQCFWLSHIKQGD